MKTSLCSGKPGTIEDRPTAVGSTVEMDTGVLSRLEQMLLSSHVRVMGSNRVRSFFTVLIGALLLAGCAAKQKSASTQPASEAATSGAVPSVSPDNQHLARDKYDRAVADYQNCVLDNTANLSACEKQKAAMNGAATILFGPSSKKNTIVNEGR